ncbi:MAG: type II toxin-antitoxin system RelE/ParE family toxin [Caldilineales bacterium]|nr:type II toxin-antitoxin system RelE/ParE family toxin [Caldilineales bacterium]
MIDTATIQILEYRTENGRSPYREWLHSLRDREARARVRVRIDRVALGNFGDWHAVGGGVSELRIQFGPGYRVYFGRQGNTVVILLCGGDKSTQTQDIELAKAYWADYQRRTA